MTTYLISRPDLLNIYAGIIARIGKESNIAIPEDSSLLEISQQPTEKETAYLKNGTEGIIKAICEDLLHLGFLEVKDDVIRVATYFKHTSHLEPIEQAIFDYLHVPKTETDLQRSQELEKAIAPYCKEYHQSLIDKGYLRSNQQKYMTAGTIGLFILASAMFKPLSGIIAAYRYMLLPALVVMPKASLAIAATAWFTTKSKSVSGQLTTKGKKYLNQ